MFEAVLDDKRISLLQALIALDALDGFCLAGGTALSLQPSIEEFIARIALELHSRLDDAYYCDKDREDLGMRDNLDYKAISARVKALRSAQEYTQETLAEAIDVSTSFIGHIERGEKKCSLETMSRLAARLGTTLDYLVLGVENRCNQQSCQLYVRLRNAIEAYSDEPILSKREIFM